MARALKVPKIKSQRSLVTCKLLVLSEFSCAKADNSQKFSGREETICITLYHFLPLMNTDTYTFIYVRRLPRILNRSLYNYKLLLNKVQPPLGTALNRKSQVKKIVALMESRTSCKIWLTRHFVRATFVAFHTCATFYKHEIFYIFIFLHNLFQPEIFWATKTLEWRMKKRFEINMKVRVNSF